MDPLGCFTCQATDSEHVVRLVDRSACYVSRHTARLCGRCYLLLRAGIAALYPKGEAQLQGPDGALCVPSCRLALLQQLGDRLLAGTLTSVPDQRPTTIAAPHPGAPWGPLCH